MFDRSVSTVANVDPEIWAAIQAENRRQEDHIGLIASENYASPAVMAAQGSQLTNKYAEGYPGRRYYGGCEYVDMAESIAIERAKKLFGAPWANVQPHSGSQANQAVYTAVLKPGDTILGLSLAMVGTILMLARLTDVVTDPIMGELSDRLRTRLGRLSSLEPPVAYRRLVGFLQRRGYDARIAYAVARRVLER